MSHEKILIAAVAGFALYTFAKRSAATTTQQPAVVVRTPGTTNPIAAQVGAVASIVNAVTSLFGGSTTRTSEAGDASSNAGEAEARAAYINNLDLFAVNPPVQYSVYTDTTGINGGWLDNQ